ncbi:Hypothetical protein HDN1F_24920 [gamma proteobacterium HdN1]|nr:Hypothetical protein HDN1F_24920 [gamma proteobacterium HdN1]
MKVFTQSLIAAAITLGAAQAHAVPYTYNFSQFGIENVSSKTYSNPGLDLTVSASATSNSGATLNRNVYADAFGLGVYGGAADGSIDLDGHSSIDNGNDALKFSFSDDVTLQSITFAFWDIDDKVNVFTLNDSGLTQVGGMGNGVFGDILGNKTLNLNALADTFVVSAADWRGALGVLWQTTDVRISGLTVDYTPSNGNNAAVPEPGTMALLGLGLVGLGLARRMQKKAAA